jgi:hypothetical protein
MAAEAGQKAFTLAGLRAASCQTQGLLRLPPSLQSAISAFIGGGYLISVTHAELLAFLWQSGKKAAVRCSKLCKEVEGYEDTRVSI